MPGSRIAGRPIVMKVMAAVGAVLLVASFALASLLQPLATLAEVVAMVDDHLLLALESAEHSPPIEWIWTHLAMPVLIRPSWLIPTMLGLVCVGVATTLKLGERR